jgi:hypothetical protein
MTQTKRTDDLYKAEALHQFAQGVFERLGMRSADADILANHLVWADLRGITWLGMRKIPQYGARLRAGGTPPQAEATTLLDTPSVVVVDDRRGCAVVTGVGLGPWKRPPTRPGGRRASPPFVDLRDRANVDAWTTPRRTRPAPGW